MFVVIAALLHIFILGRYTSTPVIKTIWLVYTVLIVYLIAWHRVIKPILKWNHKHLIQLLYDSLNDLGANMSAMTRPEAK